MNKTADVLIIGGGIIGLSSAYHLAKMGQKVILFEKEYLCAGSTGRCIGGIRQQFSSETTIKVAMESIKMFIEMEQTWKDGIEWYQGGYLFLAHNEEKSNIYKKLIQLQKQFGLDVEYISIEEIKKIVPNINDDNLLGAAYCPSDGQANPFLTAQGYAHQIKNINKHTKRKNEIYTYTEVTDIITDGNEVKGLITNKGDKFYAPKVLTAAGPFINELTKKIDIDLPVYPERHEAIVTDSAEFLFEPMLVDYREDGCYFHQKHDNGQFIGCYSSIPNVPGTSVDSTFEFLTQMSKRMLRIVPALRYVSIMRQWGGSYTMTPDGSPIMDETNMKGFYIAGGMCGHGFMLAPMLGKLMAQFMLEGKSDIPLDEFKLNRDYKAGQEAMK